MALEPLPSRIGAQADPAAIAAWIRNATILINELVADRAGEDGFASNAKTLLNALQATFQDGLLAVGTLAIDTTPEEFQTTTTAYYRIGSIQYSKAAATGVAFTAAHPVTASKFGAILVQIDAAGDITTKISGATQTTTQAYDSAPLAVAALPDADEGNVALGYIVIEADSGGWVAITDDLTDASDLTTATFNDASTLSAFTESALSDTISSMSETGVLTSERGVSL